MTPRAPGGGCATTTGEPGAEVRDPGPVPPAAKAATPRPEPPAGGFSPGGHNDADCSRVAPDEIDWAGSSFAGFAPSPAPAASTGA
jgi:hypothetical protein